MTDRTELRRLQDAYHTAPNTEAAMSAYLEYRTAAVNALPGLLDQLDAAEDAANDAILYENDCRDALARQTPHYLAAKAALARVRELHERWPIHGDGDHPEDCDCGDPWMTVCRLCCTDGKDQHETCAAHHDHGPDKPICPTIAAIGGEQS